MGDKGRVRIAGALFLAAFLFYGGGQALMASGQPLYGLALVALNSVSVAAIGVLLGAVISVSAPSIARVYFATRILEAILLFAGAGLWWLAMAGLPGVPVALGESANMNAYRVAMFILGAGSIPMCLWLMRQGGITRILSWMGLVGYPALMGAMIADALILSWVSMWLLLLAAIFELAFGIAALVGIGGRWNRPDSATAGKPDAARD